MMDGIFFVLMLLFVGCIIALVAQIIQSIRLLQEERDEHTEI